MRTLALTLYALGFALALALWAAPAACAAPVRAPTRAPAAAARSFQDWVDLGARAFRAGDYEAAVNALEAAQRLEQPPRLAFNLARAYHKAGRRADALAAYERYLAAEPDSPRRAEVEGHIAALRAELAPPSAAPQQKPLWRRPWFWGVIGAGVVVVGGAVALGVVLGTRASDQKASGAALVLTF